MDAGSAINMANTADGSTAVLVNGGNTANVLIGGTISLTDSVATDADLDADNDGDLDGPFATGTGRYGVRLAGAAPLTGNVVLESGGQIAVEGNNSYGISLEAPLTGNFSVIGGIQMAGDNSYGVRTTGDVSGQVNLVGTITARGANAVGASIEGDVGGTLRVHSAISASGYRYTTPPTVRPDGYVEPTADEEKILLLDELDADDLLQGGPALRVQGNIAGGVLLDVGPTYRLGLEGDDDGDSVKNGDEDDDGDGTKNRTDNDRDGDGLLDSLEGSAAVTSLGTAPAIAIGSTTQSISLGAVGAGDSAYGFINRGSVTGQGVYDRRAAQGVVFGGNAGQTVSIAGRVRHQGTIQASSAKANATAIRFGQGTTAPTLANTGAISVGVASDTAATATAVLFEAGANVGSLSNSGTILASVSGGVADGVAIRDLSGALASLENTGSIIANVAANADGDAITGDAIAIDVAANTTGFSLVQRGTVGTPTTSDPDTDGDGVLDSREPRTVGAINLGSGGDTLDIRNGLVLGDIAFGAGADTLSITGGASVAGKLSDSDGALAVNVANGTLQAPQTHRPNLTQPELRRRRRPDHHDRPGQ